MDKPKFNIIDGLIVLLVVAIIAAGIYLLSGNNTVDSPETQNTTAVFQLQLTRADESLYNKFLAALDTQETVWIGVKERFPGKIEILEKSPSSRITTNTQTGKAVLAEDPNLFDLTIHISTPVLETPSGITASGTPIRVGEEVAVRGKGFAGYGFVIDLKTVTE
ncbi:MAG: DUF4330 domain-containing protein [Ruminococcaceae bacterium]|nr:DUF4330 domain-containing protein [Oscillospiraceae bacterium]